MHNREQTDLEAEAPFGFFKFSYETDRQGVSAINL